MNKIKNTVKNMMLYFKIMRLHYADFKYFYKFNSVRGANSKDGQEAQILLLCHQLEKGLTHKSGSRKFGESKAAVLLTRLKKFQSKYGNENVVVLGVNVLNSYIKSEHSTDVQALRNEIRAFISENTAIVDEKFDGAKEVKIPPIFNESEIIEFFNSRSSVRDYSDAPITKEELEKAYRFAEQTPSACNRQSSRIYFFNDRKLMDSIIDNQLGDQGWCRNATGIFVVTAKNCHFNGTYERYQAFIDGGLFAMNLVLGLHLEHIATCFKMYVRGPKRDKQFRKITGVPAEEVPIILIMAGHYKAEQTYTTRSHRFPQEIIINKLPEKIRRL